MCVYYCNVFSCSYTCTLYDRTNLSQASSWYFNFAYRSSNIKKKKLKDWKWPQAGAHISSRAALGNFWGWVGALPLLNSLKYLSSYYIVCRIVLHAYDQRSVCYNSMFACIWWDSLWVFGCTMICSKNCVCLGHGFQNVHWNLHKISPLCNLLDMYTLHLIR